MSIALSLLAAHVLADFPFQDDEMANRKLDSHYMRMIHANVHFVLTAAFLFPVVANIDALVAAGCVFVAHFVIDSRRWAEPKEDAEWYPIAVDQSLHVASLWIVAVVVL